jgi:catechol 2,3-dioxygenase-like lactoylglutathione lyase family enzyme
MAMLEFTGMQPILAVGDISRNERYYVEQLGFAVTWRWGEPPVRVGVARDGFELQLVSDHRFAPSCPTRVYFLVRGVDSFYEECLARGAEIDLELGDRSFGMRDFRVEDLSGNVLGFGEAIGQGEE